LIVLQDILQERVNIGEKKDRRYVEVWLRRARKELAVSGKISELVYRLEHQVASQHDDWAAKLHQLLDGEWEPNMDELIRLDGLLSRCKAPKVKELSPLLLF
jgi:hypothetical protein